MHVGVQVSVYVVPVLLIIPDLFAMGANRQETPESEEFADILKHEERALTLGVRQWGCSDQEVNNHLFAPITPLRSVNLPVRAPAAKSTSDTIANHAVPARGAQATSLRLRIDAMQRIAAPAMEREFGLRSQQLAGSLVVSWMRISSSTTKAGSGMVSKMVRKNCRGSSAVRARDIFPSRSRFCAFVASANLPSSPHHAPRPLRAKPSVRVFLTISSPIPFPLTGIAWTEIRGLKLTSLEPSDTLKAWPSQLW